MNQQLHKWVIGAFIHCTGISIAKYPCDMRPPFQASIASLPGAGKTFMAKAIRRWGEWRDKANRRAKRDCKTCKGNYVYRDGADFKNCACCKRLDDLPSFNVGYIAVSRLADPLNSLIDLFSMSAAFGESADVARVALQNLIAADLLIIDDIGNEKNPPPTFEPGLSSLIDQRQEKKRFTLFITNIQRGDVAARYGDRIYSRMINASFPIKMMGKDRRKY